MRKQLLVYASMALGIAGLAAVPSIADDQPTDLGLPIHSLRDVENLAKVWFKLADTNGDGQISQKEANDVGNVLVGGYFFLADTNGDGAVSLDEAREARESVFTQQPLLRFIVERGKPANAPVVNRPALGGTPNTTVSNALNMAADPAGTLINLLDTNHDQKLEATELRQGVQTGVQSLFMVADTDQNGQLTPYELNAAAGQIVKSVAQSVFQAADIDRNGALSQDEYDKSIAEPAHAIFRILDANADNQLTFDEIQRAWLIIGDQLQRLRVPDQPNSLSKQLLGASRTPVTATPGTTVITNAPTTAPVVAPAPVVVSPSVPRQ